MVHQTEIVEDKILVFSVGENEYGVPINQVVSIERLKDVTPYPNRAPYVLGMTTIRDIVTPVVDVRGALTGKVQETLETTRIIVVQIKENPIGIVVDTAKEVIDIEPRYIQQPKLAVSDKSYFLLGIVKLDNRLIFLLDSEKLLEDTTNLDLLRELTHSFVNENELEIVEPN